MISKLAVFHRGGAVLWTSPEKNFSSSPGASSASDASAVSGSASVALSKTTATKAADMKEDELKKDENEQQQLMVSSNESNFMQPINKLIQDVLLSDRSASDTFSSDSYTLKWTFANNFNLVFVAVYFSFQKLLYINEFLETVKNEFLQLFAESLNESLKGSVLNLTPNNYKIFLERYRKIQRYFQKEFRAHQSKAKNFHDTKRGIQHQLFMHNDQKKSSHNDGKKTGNKKSGSKKNNKGKNGKNNSKKKNKPETKPPAATMKKSLSFGRKTFGKKNGNGKQRLFNKKNGKKNGSSPTSKNGNGSKKKKQQREWDLSIKKKKSVTAAEMDEYNMGIDTPNEGQTTAEGASYEYFVPSGEADLDDSEYEEEEEEEESASDEDFTDLLLPGQSGSAASGAKDDNNKTASTAQSKKPSGIWSAFSRLVGSKTLNSADIESVLSLFENQLSRKNVTNAIACELCENLRSQLIGSEIGTFTNIKSLVTQSLTASLERILNRGANDVNLLHGISTAREQKRPYSIVFIGVNGVGKSTTLSKVMYYLTSRNLKVSVAACDTFRAGAVEQLRTHCRALKCRLFEQGYARDSAAVAYAAVKEAHRRQDDVVLIDTAGRMQNNEPLMRSLVSLITRNNPDLVLFVGEALVGNDGIDQLLEFGNCLQKFHPGNDRKSARLIDGIILTKFDTVDDKVGAAISMTYKSKKPIVFLGTGQTYTDLQRLHARTLISQLLK